MRKIVPDAKIPDSLKSGIITPVYKNKKSIKDPDNYRRITVTSLLGKILEKIMVAPTKEILKARLNTLQRGFCDRSSSVNTALLLSEAIAEAKDKKEPIYGAFLDASKAFDVVWHDGMLLNLHQLGIKGHLWLLYKDMYTNMTSQIKLDGHISTRFHEGQGVRQGGIPSTELFKARGDKLLRTIERSRLGYQIGITSVAAPTCADDIALLSDSITNLQTMLNLAGNEATQERYNYSTSKSTTMVMNSPYPTDVWRSAGWTLSEEPLEVSSREPHLGLIREPKGKAAETVSDNLKKTRRCVYALMGAGMYGMNGLHPEVGIHLWKTYALPLLVYGLDVLKLTIADLLRLETCQHQVLGQLQHLPSGSANAAIHLITGVPPVQLVIDRNIFKLFVNVISQPSTKEHEIFTRQLAVKGPNSNSWITCVKDALARYDLPTAYDLAEHPPSKAGWKRTVRSTLYSYWQEKLKNEARRCITLRYLNVDGCELNQMHPVWRRTPQNRTAVVQACVRVKILVGRYYLQHDYNKFKKTNHNCMPAV